MRLMARYSGKSTDKNGGSQKIDESDGDGDGEERRGLIGSLYRKSTTPPLSASADLFTLEGVRFANSPLKKTCFRNE